ncbi:MAG: hypothetical protein ACWGQW_00470 [bacterium]
MEEPSPLATPEEVRHFTLREELRRRPFTLTDAAENYREMSRHIMENIQRESPIFNAMYPTFTEEHSQPFTLDDMNRQIRELRDNTARADREMENSRTWDSTDAIRYHYHTSSSAPNELVKGALKRELVEAGLSEEAVNGVELEITDFGDRFRFRAVLTFQIFQQVDKLAMRRSTVDLLAYSMKQLARSFVKSIKSAVLRTDGIEAEMEIGGETKRVLIIPLEEGE